MKVSNRKEEIEEIRGIFPEYKGLLHMEDGVQIPGEGGTRPSSTPLPEEVEGMGAHAGKFVALCQDLEEIINWWIYFLSEVDGKIVFSNSVLITPPPHSFSG